MTSNFAVKLSENVTETVAVDVTIIIVNFTERNEVRVNWLQGLWYHCARNFRLP